MANADLSHKLFVDEIVNEYRTLKSLMETVPAIMTIFYLLLIIIEIIRFYFKKIETGDYCSM